MIKLQFKSKSKYTGFDYTSTLDEINARVNIEGDSILQRYFAARNDYCNQRANNGATGGGAVGALSGAAIGTAIAPGPGTIIGNFL